MKTLLFSLLVLITSHTMASNSNISPFTTDGCSAFPDGKVLGTKVEWRHCCIIHDIDYWMGGEKGLKKKSDQDLNACVSHASNSPLGAIMEIGVAIGGKPSKLPWRWGYGWEKKKKYGKLTLEQSKSILQEMDELIIVLAQEKERLSQDQMNLIAFKVKNEISDLSRYLTGTSQERIRKYERLIKKVEELIER